jgi:hypothetical protein
MAAGRPSGRILGMSTPTVIESPLRLEPVTADPFVADLDRLASAAEATLAAAAAAPRRRIFD